MATIGETVEHFTGGEAIGVDVPAIERDLAALWRESASEERGVTRACLWNLVVRARSEEEVGAAKQLVDAIAPACPARSLLLDVRPDAAGEKELEAWISANCHIAPGGGKLLCSEEITIAARGPGRNHVPALLRALLVPDVPVALFWAGAAPRREDAGELATLVAGADRLVVDTDDALAPAGGHASGWRSGTWQALLACAQETRVTDLGWLRLAPFRVLLASCFDPPIGGGPLEKVRRVNVVVSPRGVATGELLLGWLAARLGWGPAQKGGVDGCTRRWKLPRRDGGFVVVELEVREIDAGRDGIWDILIECEPELKVRVVDDASAPGAVRVEVTGQPVRVVVAEGRPDQELLVAALGARGMDPLYAQAMLRAAELEA